MTQIIKLTPDASLTLSSRLRSEDPKENNALPMPMNLLPQLAARASAAESFSPEPVVGDAGFTHKQYGGTRHRVECQIVNIDVLGNLVVRKVNSASRKLEGSIFVVAKDAFQVRLLSARLRRPPFLSDTFCSDRVRHRRSRQQRVLRSDRQRNNRGAYRLLLRRQRKQLQHLTQVKTLQRAPAQQGQTLSQAQAKSVQQ